MNETETVKVTPEYLRQKADVLRKECTVAWQQYEETAEAFRMLGAKMQVKGIKRLQTMAEGETERAQRAFEGTGEVIGRLLTIADDYEQTERGNTDAAAVD